MNSSCFKDRLPYELVSRVAYIVQCSRCNGETDRYLKVKSEEDINLFTLTFNEG